MEYRTLGKTGLKVSVLGYGCSPLGDVFGAVDMEEARRAVHFAIDNGVNIFDVSPYYGPDALAEARLRAILKDVPRERFFLASKAGQSNPGGKIAHDYTAAGIKKSVEESLVRLHTDYLDICQVHDIHCSTVDQVVNEALPALRKLRDEGKVRFIGVTDYDLGLLKAVIERTEIDTVMSFCCYDLVSTSVAEVLAPVAQKAGIGVLNAAPLHLGLLASVPTRVVEYGLKNNKLTRAVAEAAQVCEERGTSISDLAMRFALSYEGVASTVVGMMDKRQVEVNLASVGKKPDSEILACVREIIAAGYDPRDPFGFSG